MTLRTARIEVYMKTGTASLSTRGAIVKLPDQEMVTRSVTTRLTGGTVVVLEVGAYYMYQFNVAGDGKFTLAARPDGEGFDLEREDFDGTGAKEGPHSGRSFAFKVAGNRIAD
jgi:hypothetical protein